MKSISIFSILLLLASCDPKGFGYKKNPGFVLDEALKAIQNEDIESFVDVTGQEALCLYANEAGLRYLKESINLQVSDIKFLPKVLETIHYKEPRFVNYWSYYHERYQVDLKNKTTNEAYLNAIIDCEFGVNDKKSPEYVNQNPQSYRMKECRIVKIIPYAFKSLPETKKCSSLKVLL